MQTQTQTVYLIGPSTDTQGGIGYVIGRYFDSDLRRQFRLIHIITQRDGSSLIKAWTFAKALFSFVFLKLKRGGRLVHIHSSSGPSFWRKSILLMIAKCMGCKVIFQIHSGAFIDYYQRGGRTFRFFMRRLLGSADSIVVLSDSWKVKMQEICGARGCLEVIGNPIDTGKYRSRRVFKDGAPNARLLFLGALIKGKGVYDIVECTRLLKARGLALEVTLAGNRELEQVRRCSERAGVEDMIHLPGWVSEPEKLELLKRSDLLLLPSYWEGLPLCVLEAMACGLPVVCTNVGGMVDLVTDGENGFLVAPGDVDALADCIAKLVQDPTLRNEMGRRNTEKTQNLYSLPVISQKLADLYRKVQSNRGNHARNVAETRLRLSD